MRKHKSHQKPLVLEVSLLGSQPIEKSIVAINNIFDRGLDTWIYVFFMEANGFHAKKPERSIQMDLDPANAR